jgi:hypothetical protein
MNTIINPAGRGDISQGDLVPLETWVYILPILTFLKARLTTLTFSYISHPTLLLIADYAQTPIHLRFCDF